MGKQLRISSSLALPIDVAGEAIAILAKRGAGKTNTATVLVEELFRADVQVVVLDPVGAWWGLRLDADGSPKGGLEIPILGGQRGDVPLEQTAGALIADVVVDTGTSMLLDLSDFPSKAAANRFVADFADRLYRRKNRESSLLHLVLEEADEFAPQKIRAGDAQAGKMAAAVEAIVRRGRGRGLGITMITQRSAVLNKDVLEQTDVLIAMRTTGTNDRKAIGGWIDKHADSGGEDVLASLPSLGTGEAWVWNPERSLLKRVKVRLRKTYDSSRTPKAGERRRKVELASIDLHALGEQITATVERAKASDPRELQKTIRELRKQLAERPTAKEVERVEVQVPIEVPVLDDEHVRLLGEAAWELRQVAARLSSTAEQITTALAAAERLPPVRPITPLEPARRENLPQPRPAIPVPLPVDESFRPSSSQLRILDALAWFEEVGIPSPNRPALAMIARSRPTSGGFKNNLSALRTAGLLDYPQSGLVGLTEAGRALANPPEIEQSAAGLQEAVLAAVSGSQAAILRVLIQEFPHALSREELAERLRVQVTSGGFKNNLSALRTLELLDYPQTGYVAALPLLFLQPA